MKTLLLTITTILLIGCTAPNELLTPNKNDRLVVGHKQGVIFKNRNYYKVVDGYGKPAAKVYEPDTLRPVGTILICEFNN